LGSAPEVGESMSWIKNLPSLRLLGDLLVEKEKITKEQLAEALEYQKQKGVRLGAASG